MGIRLDLVDLNNVKEEMRAISGKLHRMKALLESWKKEETADKKELLALKKDFISLSHELGCVIGIINEIAFEAKESDLLFRDVEGLLREELSQGKNPMDFCTEWEWEWEDKLDKDKNPKSEKEG